MSAFTYLYITDTLSGLNLTENKQELALFSPSVVLKHDLSPFSAAPWLFLQILLFSCLLILKINHILVIMIHFQAFIFLLWWGREVGPLFFSFSTSSVSGFLSFPMCWWRRGRGNPFTGLVLLWSVHWCPLGVVFIYTLFLCGMFVGYLEVLQGFLHCIVPWHRWLTLWHWPPTVSSSI